MNNLNYLYDNQKIPRVILLIGMIILLFITNSFILDGEYLTGDDSYYYALELKNDNYSNLYVGVIAFINFFIKDLIISNNLVVFLIISIVFWFCAEYIGNINSLILTLIMVFSDIFYNKSFNWFDTHIPVAISIIIITYYFLRKESIDRWILIPIFCMMFIPLMWNGYLFVLGYFAITSIYLFINERMRKLFMVLFPLALLIGIFVVKYLFTNYFKVKNYGVSELISGVLVFDNIILLIVLLYFLLKSYNNKTVIVLIYFIIAGLMFIRFNYFLNIILIMLIAYQSYQYFFKNEKILINYFLSQERLKSVVILLILLLTFTIYNFSTINDSTFINKEYIDIATYINDNDLNVITHYQQKYFLNYYTNIFIEGIDYYDLKYSCDFETFINYADNRMKKPYYYFLSSMDENPIKYICNDGDEIKSALIKEKIKGFNKVMCGKKEDIKFCLFERDNYD